MIHRLTNLEAMGIAEALNRLADALDEDGMPLTVYAGFGVEYFHAFDARMLRDEIDAAGGIGQITIELPETEVK